MFNIVVLHGRVSRRAEPRSLPSGDRLVTLDLTVTYPVQPDGTVGKAESVPLAWFDPPDWVTALEVDAEVVVIGRVRRRFFRPAAGPLQSRTEVIVEAGTLSRRRARVAELLGRAVETLETRT